MEPTTFHRPDHSPTTGEGEKLKFAKDHILQQAAVQQALANLERLHIETMSVYSNEARDVVNLPELFGHFLDQPDLYRELLSAKLIVALNESIPAQAEGDQTAQKTYLEAWGTLVAKVMHVLSSDNPSYQLSEGGGAQMQGAESVLLSFGTLGQRVHLNQTREKQWQLEYHLYPSDKAYGSKGFPVALSRLFPDRFFVQTTQDKRPRKLAPGEHVPLVDTSFIVDLRPGEQAIAADGTTSDIDLPPRYTE